MNWFVAHLIIIAVPLIISNVTHMIFAKYDWLRAFDIPISEKLFGANKTFRGFLIVTTMNTIMTIVVNVVFQLDYNYPELLGFTLGFAFMVFELPNSYVKRKAGIPPGGEHPDRKYLFMFMDKVDSPFGVMTVYFLMGYLELKYCLLIFIMGIGIHISVSLLLVAANLKKSF